MSCRSFAPPAQLTAPSRSNTARSYVIPEPDWALFDAATCAALPVTLRRHGGCEMCQVPQSVWRTQPQLRTAALEAIARGELVRQGVVSALAPCLLQPRPGQTGSFHHF